MELRRNTRAYGLSLETKSPLESHMILKRTFDNKRHGWHEPRSHGMAFGNGWCGLSWFGWNGTAVGTQAWLARRPIVTWYGFGKRSTVQTWRLVEPLWSIYLSVTFSFRTLLAAHLTMQWQNGCHIFEQRYSLCFVKAAKNTMKILMMVDPIYSFT